MRNRKLLFLCCIGGLTSALPEAHAWTGSGSTGYRAERHAAKTAPQELSQKLKTAMHKNAAVLIENAGQIQDQYGAVRNDIDFKLPGDRFNVFIGAGAIHYQWVNPSAAQPDGPQKLETYRLDMQLVGANTNALLQKGAPQHYKEYLADQGGEAKSYDKVTYKNVYPNIDWEIYLKNGKLEYDFVVRPGGRVSDIRVRYNGASQVRKNADGSLSAITPAGFVQEHAPYSYVRNSAGRNIPVNSSFQVKNNTAAFSVGKYKGTLVIDPVLEWGTYYGGAATEDGYGVAVDASGNVYMTGYTLSTTNIATVGAFSTQYSPAPPLQPTDAYLVKFDSNGVRQWGTYYGSSATDNGQCLAIDPWGYVYMGGTTTSTAGIATANGFQNALGGGNDAFLVKFAPDGSRIWGTYYGGASTTGTNSDFAYGLVCDAQGNVYMAGQTNSPNNIASTGAYQSTLAGNSDAFVAKFDSSGARIWGTYLGGTAFEQGRSIALDANNNIYVAGSTQSATGIASPGASQPNYGAGTTGAGDAFLIKLNNDGAYQWGTYYGGPDYDGGTSVTTDDEGNAYMTGNFGANSTGLSTTGSFQATAGGNGDAFLVKYDSTGARQWATYYGGSNIDQGNAVKYDGFGNVYLLGQTKSSNNIATAGTFQDTIYANGVPSSPPYEAFLVKFTKNGARTWGTYYGGKGDDYGKAIDLNKNTGDIYFCGQTKSPAHIVTPGCHQDTLGNMNSTDAFLVRFNECPTISNVAVHALSGTDSICPDHAALYAINNIPGATSYVWTLPDGWTGASDSNSIAVTVGNSGGTISVRAYNSCDSTALQAWNVYVFPFFSPVITVDSLTLGTASPYATYQWFLNGQPINGATNSTLHVTQNGDYKVAVTSANGCADTSAVYIVNNANGTAIVDPAGIRSLVSVYPNPAADYINILSPVAIHATLTTIEGRPLGQYKNAKTISVKGLASGVYLLRLTDASGHFIKAEKFIKE